MAVHEITHPLIAHKLGLMRNATISSKDFRELASEVGNLLTYEATRTLPTERATIESWSGDQVEVKQIKGKKITVVPILRAGLGMLEGVLELIPNAKISVVGLYRDEETLQPVAYFDKVVKNIDERTALIVDPMLATANSSVAAITRLKEGGAKDLRFLCLLAAPEGIEAFHSEHPDVPIYTAAIDECLNDHSYIVPGLGDAGDRIYGTR